MFKADNLSAWLGIIQYLRIKNQHITNEIQQE